MRYFECGVFVFWGIYQCDKCETIANETQLENQGRRVEAYNWDGCDIGQMVF
jgi:hypothetical protein